MSAVRRQTRHVVLNGRRVGYTIQESRTARKCRVRVSPAGVAVVLPKGEDETRAVEFLRANASWVLDQLAFQERMGSFKVAGPKQPDNMLLLRGKSLRVEVCPEPSRRQFALVEQQGQTIRVRVPEDSRVDVKKALEAWLRRQARQDILARLEERTVQMKVNPGRLYVMGQRTKWGNCSRLRNLSFNWRLAMAPPSVLDYLVVHELTHLIEPYHSTKFWLIVRSYCPGYEQSKSWLREHCDQLQIHNITN